MKRFTTLAALFCLAAATAQPYRPTTGRDPVRGSLVAYPTAAEASAGGMQASRYLAPLDDWTQEGTIRKTDFTVPFAWANRHIWLHVGPATAEYEIYVNGQPVAYNANPNAPADFNLTKYAREGKNALELRLATPSPGAPLESWKNAPAPAIGRTYVFSQPTMRVRDVTVKTWPAEGGTKAEVGIVVRTGALNPKTSRIHYALLTPGGEAVASGHGDLTLDMRREDTLRFVTDIPDSLLWSARHPRRLTLALKTQYEGRYVEYLHLPLGFRSVEMRDGQPVINGQPTALKIKEVTPDLSGAQIGQLKTEGYNTLKLRAGAVPEGFYDLCDSVGIYVVAQAPIDTRLSGEDIRRGGNPTNDPAWLGAYLERTADSYHAAKGHPSVIAFSLAEKSANGINLYESYLQMKRTGDPRPFIYPDAGGQWNSDRLAPAPLTCGQDSE